MGEVVNLSQYRRAKNRRGMCAHGFHKWKVWQDKQFDTQRGKLVTVYRCHRCDAEKVLAH